MHPKHSLYRVRVAHADLDMCLVMKSRPRVNRIAFDEYASQRVYCGQIACAADLVEIGDDGAIELATQRIAAVRGQRLPRCLCDLGQVCMRISDLANAGRSRDIQAEAQIDDGSNDGRGLDLRPAAESLQLPREVDAPLWIGFPEIGSRPQPVVIVTAGVESFALNQLVGDRTIASVKSENEGRRERLQGLFVVLCQIALGRVDAELHERLAGRLRRCRDARHIFFRRLPELIGILTARD